MKGFYIFEEEFVKGTVDCLEIGYIDHTFTHQIDSGTLSEEVKIHALVSKGTKTKCSPDDTYDFETGALIALMKKCGVDKVVRACNEAFSEERYNTYIAKLEGKLHDLKKDFNKVRDLKDFYKKNYEDVKEHYGKLGERSIYLIEDINKKLEYIKEKDEEIKNLKKEKEQIIVARSILNNKLLEENKKLKKNIDELFESEQYSKSELGRLYFEKHRLEEEVEKLQLDCEKLCHGYVDTDMIFCGGRQNGKQYTLLVDLFKKIDQKKVDAAYKGSKEKAELPRTLDINGTVYRKSIQIKDFGEQINKLTVDSLIEQSRAFTRKCVDEWLYKIPTKREKKWERILELHKENDVIIEVKKEDVKTFLHEIEDKIPEITWASDVKIFEAKGTLKDIYEELKTHNRIYFRLSKKNKLSYSSDLNTYLFVNLDMISYLPLMRWDLFKKGRIIVGVRNNNELEEFRKEVERNTGIKNIPTCPTNLCLFYMFDKDNYKIILNSVTAANIAKINGHKVVYWEDVR